MLLSQRSLQMMTFLLVLSFACFATCQENDKQKLGRSNDSIYLCFGQIPTCTQQEKSLNSVLRLSSKRAVAEHQLLNDQAKVLQGLKRLLWLHNAMGGVHTASGRDISQAHIIWTSPKNQDFADLYDNTGREGTPDTMKHLLLELLEKESPFALLRKTNMLQYLKNSKGSQNLQDLSDLFQFGDQDGKRNLSAQT